MDIYFEEEYAKIYELNGDGRVEKFCYECEGGRVEYLFLKRQIKSSFGEYYDLTTPYGYGGPLIKADTPDKLKEVVSGFRAEFNSYCRENRIVSEFIRFHPFIKNYQFMEEHLDTVNAGQTIYMDLESEDGIMSNMTRTCRKAVRKSEKLGITVEVDNSGETWEKFVELYYMTMNKNAANNYYYFSREYFNNIREFLGDRALIFKSIYEGKIISAMLILIGKDIIHGHLLATNPDYYKESPNNILIYTGAMWGFANGYKAFHLGGGYGGEEDSIFKFKSSFNKEGTLEFFIGEKIHDEEAYTALTREHEENNPDIKGKNEKFFPAYRR